VMDKDSPFFYEAHHTFNNCFIPPTQQNMMRNHLVLTWFPWSFGAWFYWVGHVVC